MICGKCRIKYQAFQLKNVNEYNKSYMDIRQIFSFPFRASCTDQYFRVLLKRITKRETKYIHVLIT